MPDLPEGFRLVEEAVSDAVEREVLGHLEALELHDVVMRGQVAKRRTRHFGVTYGYESWQLTPADPPPPWLDPLRDVAVALTGTPAEAWEEVLVSEYPAGAGIGWHRDAPMFGGEVVGVSLGAPCRFRFQRGKGPARETAEAALPPRSAYVLAGAARWSWQHHIPPIKEPRWSVTFRTVRSERR